MSDSVHEVNLELSAANMHIGHRGDGVSAVCRNRYLILEFYYSPNATKRQGSDDSDSNHRLLFATDHDDPAGEEDAEEVRSTQFSKFNY